MHSKQDLEPLLHVQQNDFNVVFEESNSIDNKALALLAANVAIIIFIAQEGFAIPGWQFALMYAPFGLSLLLDVIAVWPRKYLSGAVDLEENQFYLGMPRDDLVLQLLTDTVHATTNNNRINRTRLRYSVVSILLTGLGLAALLGILHI